MSISWDETESTRWDTHTHCARALSLQRQAQWMTHTPIFASSACLIQSNIVRVHGYFYFRNHLCITFEPLSIKSDTRHWSRVTALLCIHLLLTPCLCHSSALCPFIQSVRVHQEQQLQGHLTRPHSPLRHSAAAVAQVPQGRENHSLRSQGRSVDTKRRNMATGGWLARCSHVFACSLSLLFVLSA